MDVSRNLGDKVVKVTDTSLDVQGSEEVPSYKKEIGFKQEFMSIRQTRCVGRKCKKCLIYKVLCEGNPVKGQIISMLAMQISGKQGCSVLKLNYLDIKNQAEKMYNEKYVPNLERAMELRSMSKRKRREALAAEKGSNSVVADSKPAEVVPAQEKSEVDYEK